HDIASLTEVPIRTSGSRAVERNPYSICLGCNGVMEATEDYQRTKEDYWHEECYRDHNEQQLPE
ncbi:hypothetical protein BKA70DRAFT_1085639, partial [Coprinopsis sp. MPI-PUGE-AT-0042]